MFYERLLVACDLRKKAHTTLLRKLGCSPGMTSGWKTGSFPRADIVVRLADELNVSTDYLLERVDSPDMYSADSRMLDKQERELIDGIRFAPESTKQIIFRISKAALLGEGMEKSTVAATPSFSSHHGPIPAHGPSHIRPYFKHRQASDVRALAGVWKGVEGKVAAGPPITAVPLVDQHIMVPVKYTGEQYFIVQVEGDSMTGIVEDGEYCVLNKYGHYDDGNIVLVQVDGPTDQPDATLKRIYRRAGNKVELRSENRKYHPMIYPMDEVLVMGELVTVLRPDAPDSPRP